MAQVLLIHIIQGKNSITKVMKFFVVFAAVAAVACATPTMWTLSELDQAIQNPTTSANFKPVLLNALDVFMNNLFQGHEVVPMSITTQAGSVGTFSLTELSHAIESEQIDAIFMPYFEKALNTMMTALFSGQNMNEISVDVPAFMISAWTLKELDDAVTSSETNPKLLPYLEDALNKFVAAVFFGQTIDNIVVVAPADLFSSPSPAPAPATPVAVGEPVVQDAPSESASISPLVQIILNVQSNQEFFSNSNSFFHSRLLQALVEVKSYAIEQPARNSARAIFFSLFSFIQCRKIER
ncbi:hypothetical protein evm_013550 [Chilo suppressalis]|nr:hypothetical protein evm_013550 [Chilo suppressalis]